MRKILLQLSLVLAIAVNSFVIKTATAQSYPVTVSSATASSTLDGTNIANVLDGNVNTYYSSPQDYKPVTLDFNFVDAARIDELVYYPSPSNWPYGRIVTASIWYSTITTPDNFIKLQDVNWNGTTDIRYVTLNGTIGVLNPAVIRLVIAADANGLASCAEMQFNTEVPIIPADCGLGTVYPTIPADIKQTVTSATASSEQGGYPLSNTIDGNIATQYESRWGFFDLPITLDYFFTGVEQIDNIIYKPRKTGGAASMFGETEIWYTTTTNTTFTKLCDYDFGKPVDDIKIILPSSIINPTAIRIIVKNSSSNGASCSEMEFNKSTASTTTSTIFKDNIYSGLNAGVTQVDIDAMETGFYKNMAQCMFNGTYNTTYRVQEYEPYPKQATTASALKISTGAPSYFENPTGIYFEAGETAMIYCTYTNGLAISMKVYDYTTSANTYQTYALSTGMNKIAISTKGVAYINYYTDNYASLGKIKIHIAGGKINRYYDYTKTATEWKSMLVNAVSDYIDLKGTYVQLHYPVAALKQYCPNDAKTLIEFYDQLIYLQYQQLGLVKYNKVPKHHMYARAADGASFSWYAGSMGVNFTTLLDQTCSPVVIRKKLHGISHEFGHANQISPGLKWGGTTEVTNNILAVWANYTLGIAPNHLTLENEWQNDAYYDGTETGTGYGKGNGMYGGRFNAFLNNGVLKKNQWCWQYGTDNIQTSGTEDWATRGGDFFVRLAPLWQLELYYQQVHPEKADWYGNIAEKVRNTNETGMSDGTLQLNFIKNVCDEVKEDLTDFFAKVGMLRVINRSLDDYGTHTIVISAADSAAVRDYVASKGYAKPETPVLYYLTANSINAYKNKLAVEGTAGAGCTYTNVSADDGGYKNYVTVSHSVWKNVAVFETYSGSVLKRISMVGSGTQDNSSTRVYYPTGATAIYAVGYNGAKTLVYPAPALVTETWNGTGTWNTAANWSTGTVPASGSNIVVGSGTLTVDQNVAANSFTINAGANVTVASGNTLAVAGNFSLLSGASTTASLINNSTLTVAGTTSAQSYLTGNKWHIVSPAAMGQTVAEFLTANTSIPTNTGTNVRGMMDYNETANDWNAFYPASGATGSMDAGKGYSVRVVTDGVITFTGLLTSGSKDVTVTRTGDNGWNCVGNPYPSAINMNGSAAATDNFISQNSGNLDPSYAAVYIWDEGDTYDGSQRYYKVISNSGFTLPVTSLGQNVVQSGQGFLVKAKTSPSVVSFTPAMQVHSTATTLKSGNVSWPGFELIASSADVKASTVVAFNSAMTTGLDPTYDAGLLRGTSGVSLYTRLVDDNGVDFAIQCLPEAYDSLVIPIGLDCAEGGEISFSVGVSNLPATCSVILEDKTAKTFTRLDGGTSYKATVVAGATVAGRFYIHTSNLTTGTGELGLTDAFSLKSYIDGDFIRIAGKVGRSAKAYLSTVDGRRIGNYNLQEGSLNSIPAASLAPGVYLLNITDSGNRYSNKIVII